MLNWNFFKPFSEIFEKIFVILNILKSKTEINAYKIFDRMANEEHDFEILLRFILEYINILSIKKSNTLIFL